MDHNDRRESMQLAIQEMEKSKTEQGRRDHPPRVGAVLVDGNEIIGTAFRGETGPGDHAEFALLDKKFDLEQSNLSDAVLFTTLEPCTIRSSKKTPCANRIIRKKIKEVVIGLLDPNRAIQGDGVWLLQEEDVAVTFFDPDLTQIIRDANVEFIRQHRVVSWLPPPEIRSLDDWYRIINAIYLDKNSQRSPEWIFSHLVEVIGGLSFLSTHKKKSGINIRNYLPKILAWWFALCGTIGLRSIEDMVWNKFPSVCPYCWKVPHDHRKCLQIKSLSRTPDWQKLGRIAAEKNHERPHAISEWREMLYNIYPVGATEDYHIVFGRLSEELGELAECIRVIDMIPNSFLSEAADVFAWLMHLTSLVESREQTTIDLSALLFDRFPDRCTDCNSAICSCPPLLPRSINRMTHEGPPLGSTGYSSYFLSPKERTERFNIGSNEIRIDGVVLDLSPQLIQEVYGFVVAFQQALRSTTSLSLPLRDRLLSWCLSMSALAASQRVSQRIVDEFLLVARAQSAETRNQIVRLLTNLPESALREALRGFVQSL